MQGWKSEANSQELVFILLCQGRVSLPVPGVLYIQASWPTSFLAVLSLSSMITVRTLDA